MSRFFNCMVKVKAKSAKHPLSTTQVIFATEKAQNFTQTWFTLKSTLQI